MVSRKTDHSDFGMPGGKVEQSDRTLIMAATREIKEETGVDVFNLEMIFAMHINGRMGYTYLADYSGEIDFDYEKEPHVVKWDNYSKILAGKYRERNEMVYKALLSRGINVKY